MYVIYMKNEYNYYIRIIKPIENKYNRMCVLYSIFGLNTFKEKKNFYNTLLLEYYKMLQDDENYAKKLEEKLTHKK